VAGLLLIGLVADGDGLFRQAGQGLARVARSGPVLVAGAFVIIAVVTATLNLDTSVAFLTPVLVYTARSRAAPAGRAPAGPVPVGAAAAAPSPAGTAAAEAALLYGCLLLSNAGSLLLPGSNLTNLIVLGHLRLTGGQFAARMWPSWLAATGVTAVVIALLARQRPVPAGRDGMGAPPPGQREDEAALAGAAPGLAGPDEAGPGRGGSGTSGPGGGTAAGGRAGAQGGAVRLGAGLAAILLATVAVVTLRSPAIPVAALGAVAAGIRLAQRRVTLRQALDVLSLPVLAGLLGLAVALGALGRAWAGPAALLGHLDGGATAALAAAASVLVNNLPAASLLAARAVSHPFSLLVGLNLGPNLGVTGSLAWLLWLRAARGAGARPSLRRASALGLVAVPLSMAAALAGLALTGAR
jgi:arsenical pump membrane protein